MDEVLYERNARAVFSVFEQLRRELAEEADDSPVLARLHEISTMPEKEFFAGLQQIAEFGPNASGRDGELLTRCATLGGISNTQIR